MYSLSKTLIIEYYPADIMSEARIGIRLSLNQPMSGIFFKPELGIEC